MLLNAALQQTDVMRLLSHNELLSLMFERWPHWVHYRGRGKPVHCPPDTFGFIGKPGLTDCDWMIPRNNLTERADYFAFFFPCCCASSGCAASILRSCCRF
jgi:hypothetical protein